MKEAMTTLLATNIFNAFPLPSLLVSVDSTFIIRSVNKAYLDETNKLSEDLLGKSIVNYFAENRLDFASLEQSLREVISTKQTQKLFVQLNDENKIEFENIPVFDENQDISCIIHSLKKRIVSKPKYAENELALLKNNIHEPYVFIDRNLQITSFNQRFVIHAREYLGFDVRPGVSILDMAQPERREIIAEKYRYVLQGHKIQSKVEVKTKNGTILKLSITDSPILNDISEVIGVFITVWDITEQAELEKKQKDQEADFKALIENTPDLIYSINLDFNLITFNTSLSNLILSSTGIKLERGMNIFNLFGGNKRKKYIDILEKVKKEGRCIFEDKFILNTEIVIFEVAVNPIFDENKQFLGVTIFSKNITEQKKIKKQEEEQRTEFKALVDNMTDIVYSLDMNYNFITFNKAMIDVSMSLIGQPPQKGMNLIENFAFGKDEYLLKNLSKASKGKSTRFWYEEHIGNELQIFEVYVNPIFNDDAIQTGFSVLSKVVTEQVKAERAKEKTLHTLNNIMSLSLDVICTIDNQGKFTNINAAIYKLLGYRPEEVIGKLCFDFIYPEDIPMSREIGKKIIDGKGIENFENRYVHKDGRIIDVLWSMRRESKEEVLYCTAKDITEKKAIENVLIESFNRYKYLFENNPAPMLIFDFKTLQIIDCNTEALYTYGYEREEFLQLTIKDIRPKEDIPIILDLTRSEESYGNIHRGVFRHLKKSGEIMMVEVVGHLIELSGKKVGLVQVKDVTDKERALRILKENEEKLRAATIIAKLAYWKLDKDRQFSASDEIFNVLGIQKTCSLDYNSWLNIIHDDDKQLYITAENAAFEGGNEIDVEIRIVLKSETSKWVHIKGKAEKGIKENVIFLEGTLQDISEQKKAQIALQERNFFIETALENLPIGISVNRIDDGVNTLMNKKFEEIYGWPKKVVKDIPTFFENVYPDEAYRAEIFETFMSDINSGDLNRMSWEGVEITTQLGEKRVISAKNIPIYAQNLMISTVIDDTERVKAQKNLIQSNERYNFVTQATSDAIWDWDLVNNTVFRGGGFENIFGHEESGLSSTIESWKAYIHPEDVDRIIGGIQVALDSEVTNWKDEYRYLKANGKYAYVIDKGFILRDNQGKAIRMVGAIQDITERKEKEQLLKLFESVIINNNDAVIISKTESIDESGPKVMYVNQAFTRMTGYTADEILGKTVQILRGPKSDKQELARLNNALRKGEFCEISIIKYKKNGEEFWVNISVMPVADEKGIYSHWIAIEKDITEKVNYERELIEANRKVISTLESIQDGFYSLDKNWIVTYWNKEMENFSQVKREDIIGENFWDYFTKLIQLKFYSEFHRAVAENIPVRFEEYLSLSEQWFEVSAFPSDNGITVYTRDITERKNIEQKIRSERKLLRTLIDNLPDTIYFKDTEARKLISNRVDLSLQGVSNEEEVIGKTDLELYPDKNSCLGYEQDMEILRTGKAIINYEESFKTNDEHLLWLQTSKIPVYDDSKQIIGLLGIGRDITERKLAEQKLESVNKELQKYVQQLLISNAELEQFAYVASHDLQEPLRMVTSFLSQIERKYKDIIDEKGKQYIFFAVDGAKRMRQIILDLLEFSRVGKAEDKLELIDLNELVNEILVLYRKQIKDKKAVILSDTLPSVRTSKSSMRHVFQNLISNSLKYVNTQEGFVPQINIFVKSESNDWIFAIKDNGIGIDSQYFEKIFIIFQRLHSKDEYSGTGIGLAITKKIIENLGGRIWVESEPNHGSTFYFTIPKQLI
ncbi:hypothetical protein GCM10027035_18240 [Emticicia sediminis]